MESVYAAVVRLGSLNTVIATGRLSGSTTDLGFVTHEVFLLVSVEHVRLTLNADDREDLISDKRGSVLQIGNRNIG